MVNYRSFRNTDPPLLVEVWNETFTNRGAVRLRHSTPLEYHVFAKPYFDPAGLIVAEENGAMAGFVHAGFGANDTETELSTAVGVICALGVRPAFRNRGIGKELLRRAEEYLRGHGATAVHAGPLRPLNPFYLGLLGGSDVAGFLASDPAAEVFFTHQGFQVEQTDLVFQRRVDRPLTLADIRFAAHRNRFELRIGPRKETGTWWDEVTLGLVEPFDFRLEEKQGGKLAAQVSVWEMEGFSWRWNQPSVGILDVNVRRDLRRQGIAKFLLAQILRYLQDQFFGLVEVHALEQNEAGVRLFRGLGFEQVDTGRMFRRIETGTIFPSASEGKEGTADEHGETRRREEKRGGEKAFR